MTSDLPSVEKQIARKMSSDQPGKTCSDLFLLFRIDVETKVLQASIGRPCQLRIGSPSVRVA